MHSPEEREQVLSSLKDDLESSLGDNIISATVYGSSLFDDYCSFSDIDILLVLKKADIHSFKKLKEIRKKYEAERFDIDINVHSYDEMPDVRGKTFWHNNRALYMQIELSLYGQQLIGDNIFDGKKVGLDDLRLEVVRVISSLAYQARKMLINSELTPDKKIIMMKWCIYGVMYALAFWEIYPKTKKESMQIFHEKFCLHVRPVVFLKNKLKEPDNIHQSDLDLAYDFLSELQSSILNEYHKIYG
jgi:predicted nucleotidyltransferase